MSKNVCRITQFLAFTDLDGLPAAELKRIFRRAYRLVHTKATKAHLSSLTRGLEKRELAVKQETFLHL